jgi:Domain of unknown function (DUF6434)/SAP domain-containing new25
MQRPAILDIQSGDELKKWYWLKAELVTYAKTRNISYVGSKFELLQRLVHTLDGKENKDDKKNKPTSKFNWAQAILTPQTIITDSYTNGPNTRKFFKEHCGPKFSFSIAFMAWMKANIGKNLADAITEWKRLEKASKVKSFKSEIPSGNQYNQYIRDFFIDNPKKSIQEARYFWKLKRSLPLEKHVYEKSDLELK